MLIRQVHLEGIAAGAITLAFRRWRSPSVRTGSTLRTTIGVLAIDSVDIVRAEEITQSQAIAAGYASLALLLHELESRPDGALYCIRLRMLGPDPREQLRHQSMLSEHEVDQVCAALQRLDKYSKLGPWTHSTLKVIADKPNCRAADLATILGFDKEWLKLNVRKLKELGLTESLATGYRLSPRGKEVYAKLSHEA